MKRAISGFPLAALAAAIIAACSGPSAETSMPSMPGGVARGLSTVADRGRPMLPEAKNASALIYAGVWATNDVYVFDYSTGKEVGTLTGFDEPYGQCVDAKGDVYIANFGAGSVVEYAHGGSKVLNTYSSGGEPIGCSVDAKGDLAVTSFSPGEAVVFAAGDPSQSTTYSGSCTYQWAMGYDDKGNLVGIGEESTGSIVGCALLSGSKSITTLSGCCTGPITIDFPGGTMWDGEHIGIGDQEADGSFQLGIWPSTLSGTTLSSKGEVALKECFGTYSDNVNAFILGEKNTPLNKKQAKVIVGPGPACSGGGVRLWHYPSGTPFKHFKVSEGAVYGVSVSLAP